MYTVNETNNVSMVCRADSVPQAMITWSKTGNSEILAYGEQFQIFNTSNLDDGTYTCVARNYLGSDSREIALNVQSKLNDDKNVKYKHIACHHVFQSRVILGRIFDRAKF